MWIKVTFGVHWHIPSVFWSISVAGSTVSWHNHDCVPTSVGSVNKRSCSRYLLAKTNATVSILHIANLWDYFIPETPSLRIQDSHLIHHNCKWGSFLRPTSRNRFCVEQTQNRFQIIYFYPTCIPPQRPQALKLFQWECLTILDVISVGILLIALVTSYVSFSFLLLQWMLKRLLSCFTG